jgi:hypothetical protein
MTKVMDGLNGVQSHIYKERPIVLFFLTMREGTDRRGVAALSGEETGLQPARF